MPAKVVTISEIADKIDELGFIQSQLQTVRNLVKRRSILRKEIQEYLAENFEPDDTSVERGEEFILEFGKTGSSRKIVDMSRVRKEMGDDLFMQCANVTLKDIDTYLTPSQVEGAVITERNGPRTLTIMSWDIIDGCE